ncbi:hypothetical protein DFJ63DRAFT_314248 [Scheffersomyces coipomensis]|uniref:uncharacterized protein n=1 Tax=Scheffersomyces coipomensis TaxID=1788519 RepID=UPI00315D7E46
MIWNRSMMKSKVDDIEDRLLRLNQILEIKLSQFTPYDKKRVITEVDFLFKTIELKRIQLSQNRFEFKGNPIPPESNMIQTKGKIVKTGLNVNVNTYNELLFKDISNQRFKLSVEQSEKHVLLLGVESSIIDQDKSMIPSSTHIKQVKHSIINLKVEGPIFIHDVSYSILILNCHQLRLHNITNCIIIIEQVMNDRIIIENCTDLLIMAKNEGQVIEVDDFNWPTKMTINPHYKYIPNNHHEYLLNQIHYLLTDIPPNQLHNHISTTLLQIT